MSADRYEISEGELDVLAITGPEGTRYIDGEDIEARAIRQQARDLEQLRSERDRLAQHNLALRNTVSSVQGDLLKVLDQRDKLRAELAECRKKLEESKLHEVSWAFSELSGPHHDHG